MKIHCILKTIAFFICAIFTFNTVVQSAPDWLSSLNVDPECGTIESRFRAPEATKTVVLIEDAHENLSAQEKIASILLSLNARSHDDATLAQFLENPKSILFGVEGGSQRINLTSLRTLPLKEARIQASDDLLREGYITATEYAALIADNELDAWGVEDRELFLKNYTDFFALQNAQSEIKEWFEHAQDALRELKRNEWNETLRTFDESLRAVRAGSDKENAFIFDIVERAKKTALDIYLYPHVILFAEILTLEKSLDKESLRREINALPKALDVREFVFNAEELFESSDALSRLFTVIEKNGVDIRAYKTIYACQILQKKYALLEVSKLLSELDALSCALKNEYARTFREKTICDIESELEESFNLLTLRATRLDIERFKAECGGTIREGLTQKQAHIARSFHVFSEYALVQSFFYCQALRPDIFTHVDSFYAGAEKREESLVTNLFRRMDHARKTRGVLVAGGYHTEGLKRILRERGASYLVLRPRVLNEASSAGYMERMLGRLMPVSPHLSSYLYPSFSSLNSGTLEAFIAGRTNQQPTPFSHINALLSELSTSQPEAIKFITHAYEKRYARSILKDPDLVARLRLLAYVTDDTEMKEIVTKILEHAELAEIEPLLTKRLEITDEDESAFIVQSLREDRHMRETLARSFYDRPYALRDADTFSELPEVDESYRTLDVLDVPAHRAPTESVKNKFIFMTIVTCALFIALSSALVSSIRATPLNDNYVYTFVVDRTSTVMNAWNKKRLLKKDLLRSKRLQEFFKDFKAWHKSDVVTPLSEYIKKTLPQYKNIREREKIESDIILAIYSYVRSDAFSYYDETKTGHKNIANTLSLQDSLLMEGYYQCYSVSELMLGFYNKIGLGGRTLMADILTGADEGHAVLIYLKPDENGKRLPYILDPSNKGNPMRDPDEMYWGIGLYDSLNRDFFYKSYTELLTDMKKGRIYFSVDAVRNSNDIICKILSPDFDQEIERAIELVFTYMRPKNNQVTDAIQILDDIIPHVRMAHRLIQHWEKEDLAQSYETHIADLETMRADALQKKSVIYLIRGLQLHSKMNLKDALKNYEVALKSYQLMKKNQKANDFQVYFSLLQYLEKQAASGEAAPDIELSMDTDPHDGFEYTVYALDYSGVLETLKKTIESTNKKIPTIKKDPNTKKKVLRVKEMALNDLSVTFTPQRVLASSVPDFPSMLKEYRFLCEKGTSAQREAYRERLIASPHFDASLLLPYLNLATILSWNVSQEQAWKMHYMALALLLEKRDTLPKEQAKELRAGIQFFLNEIDSPSELMSRYYTPENMQVTRGLIEKYESSPSWYEKKITDISEHFHKTFAALQAIIHDVGTFLKNFYAYAVVSISSTIALIAGWRVYTERVRASNELIRKPYVNTYLSQRAVSVLNQWHTRHKSLKSKLTETERLKQVMRGFNLWDDPEALPLILKHIKNRLRLTRQSLDRSLIERDVMLAFYHYVKDRPFQHTSQFNRTMTIYDEEIMDGKRTCFSGSELLLGIYHALGFDGRALLIDVLTQKSDGHVALLYMRPDEAGKRKPFVMDVNYHQHIATPSGRKDDLDWQVPYSTLGFYDLKSGTMVYESYSAFLRRNKESKALTFVRNVRESNDILLKMFSPKFQDELRSEEKKLSELLNEPRPDFKKIYAYYRASIAHTKKVLASCATCAKATSYTQRLSRLLDIYYNAYYRSVALESTFYLQKSMAALNAKEYRRARSMLAKSTNILKNIPREFQGTYRSGAQSRIQEVQKMIESVDKKERSWVRYTLILCAFLVFGILSAVARGGERPVSDNYLQKERIDQGAGDAFERDRVPLSTSQVFLLLGSVSLASIFPKRKKPLQPLSSLETKISRRALILGSFKGALSGLLLAPALQYTSGLLGLKQRLALPSDLDQTYTETMTALNEHLARHDSEDAAQFTHYKRIALGMNEVESRFEQNYRGRSAINFKGAMGISQIRPIAVRSLLELYQKTRIYYLKLALGDWKGDIEKEIELIRAVENGEEPLTTSTLLTRLVNDRAFNQRFGYVWLFYLWRYYKTHNGGSERVSSFNREFAALAAYNWSKPRVDTVLSADSFVWLKELPFDVRVYIMKYAAFWLQYGNDDLDYVSLGVYTFVFQLLFLYQNVDGWESPWRMVKTIGDTVHKAPIPTLTLLGSVSISATSGAFMKGVLPHALKKWTERKEAVQAAKKERERELLRANEVPVITRRIIPEHNNLTIDVIVASDSERVRFSRIIERAITELKGTHFQFLREFVSNNGIFVIVDNAYNYQPKNEKCIRVQSSALRVALKSDEGYERLKETILLQGLWSESQTGENLTHAAIQKIVYALEKATDEAESPFQRYAALLRDMMQSEESARSLYNGLASLFINWRFLVLTSEPVFLEGDHAENRLQSFFYAALSELKKSTTNERMRSLYDALEGMGRFDSARLWKEIVAPFLSSVVRADEQSSLQTVLYHAAYKGLSRESFNGAAIEPLLLSSYTALLEKISNLKAESREARLRVAYSEDIAQSREHMYYIEQIFASLETMGIRVETVTDMKSADLVIAFYRSSVSSSVSHKVFNFNQNIRLFMKELVYFSLFVRVVLEKSINDEGRISIDFNLYPAWARENGSGFGFRKELASYIEDEVIDVSRARVVNIAA
jgi:hypothetical protein